MSPAALFGKQTDGGKKKVPAEFDARNIKVMGFCPKCQILFFDCACGREVVVIKISPSVLACDFSKFGEEVRRAADAGADMIHLDVMDGNFVPNISFGPDVIKSVRGLTDICFDVHLMIENPGRYIDQFVAAGADIITIHYESCEDQKEVLKAIRESGVKSAISIKPATPAFVLDPLLPYVDMILVMTVEPGFGGQKFMEDTMESVRTLRSMIADSGYPIDIEVDGGINMGTAKIAAAAGANILVAGSALYGAPDMTEAIRTMRDAAEQASNEE